MLNGQSFTADDMARMEAAFGKAGLSDYTVEGSRIKVSEGRKAAFLGALADAGAMPAHFGDYLSTAAAGSRAKYSGTGVSRMMLPLPDADGSVEPQ